jgi:hypothetical protein
MIVYLFSLLSPAPNIQAYLDPGSGSFIIQLIIGGIVGLLLVVRTFWGRIKLFFNNLLGRETAVETETEHDEENDHIG